jgi:hypothetical protein
MKRHDFRVPTPDVNVVLAALGLPECDEESGVLYHVIRGSNGPRWLLPHRSRTARAILAEWHPYGLKTRIAWRGIRAAARAGALHLAPGATQIRVPRDAGRRMLSQFGFAGDAEPPVILVGNTEAARKLLVFLTSPDHGTVAIKVPLTPMARASIRNEADVLGKLDGRYGAPRLLGYQKDTGASMQAYLFGRMGSRRAKPGYVSLLIELARSCETVTLRARATALCERLRAHASYEEWAPLLEPALGLLEEDTPLPSALVHGDFTPWNLRETRGGGCTLIDWESAEWAGMPLHDLCHFFFIQAIVFAPRSLFYHTLEREGSWRRYCVELRIPPALLPRLAAAYLLRVLIHAWEWEPPQYADFCRRQLKAFLEVAARA